MAFPENIKLSLKQYHLTYKNTKFDKSKVWKKIRWFKGSFMSNETKFRT